MIGRMSRRLPIACALILAGGAAWTSGAPRVTAQSPSGIRVVPVSAPDARRPAEASVAINPTNPEHVISTFIQTSEPGVQPRSSNWGYVSIDGGLTWTGTPAANPEARVQGDDVIVFGRDGTAYHTYISFDGIRVERPERASSGIHVRRTQDGVRWEAAVAVVDHLEHRDPDGRQTVDGGRPRGGLAAPRQPVRGLDALRRLRQRRSAASQPHLVRALERLRTLVPAPHPHLGRKRRRRSTATARWKGAVPAVGPGGEVYVAWAGPAVACRSMPRPTADGPSAPTAS